MDSEYFVSFLFLRKRRITAYAKNKTGKRGLYRLDGILHGLFHDLLYRGAPGRRRDLWSVRPVHPGMWIEFAFVFLLVFFGVSRIAPRIALKLLHPRELPQILFTLVVQGLTVSMVVQAVTLFASLLHGGVNPGFSHAGSSLPGSVFRRH